VGEPEALRFLFGSSFQQTLKPFFAMYLDERFAVGCLPDNSVEEAVEAYVRINRSGVRVQPEERALAVLTRWYPGILGELAEFMRRRDGVATSADPRALLTHQADRTFGFSLWIRSVVRFAVLRMLPRTALRWLSADSIERWTISDWLSKHRNDTEGVIRDAAQRASTALLIVDRLLSSELFLDHRMARPDTRSMLPLLELLSRLSSEDLEGLLKEPDEDLQLCLARVLQWTMLHPYLDQSELETLCVEIHGRPRDEVHRTESLVPLVIRYLQEFHRLWKARVAKGQGAGAYERPSWDDLIGDLTAWAGERFGKLLEESRSLQHPAVGWLYAIERRAGATEFDWHEQVTGCKAPWNGLPKLPIDATVYPLQANPASGQMPAEAPATQLEELLPEKQHIVPFVDAHKIVRRGGNRNVASPANQVGNLTWLSARQNGMENGFWERWMIMGDPEQDRNLTARGFGFSLDGQTAAESYRKLFEGRGSVKDLHTLLEEFERFCAIRREWMNKEMARWLDDRSKDAVLAVVTRDVVAV